MNLVTFAYSLVALWTTFLSSSSSSSSSSLTVSAFDIDLGLDPSSDEEDWATIINECEAAATYNYTFTRPVPVYDGTMPHLDTIYVIKSDEIDGNFMSLNANDKSKTAYVSNKEDTYAKWKFIKSSDTTTYNSFVLKNTDAERYLYIPSPTSNVHDKVYATTDINLAAEFELVEIGTDSTYPISGTDKHPALFFIRSTQYDTNLVIKGDRIYNYERGNDPNRVTNWIIYPYDDTHTGYECNTNNYFVRPYYATNKFLRTEDCNPRAGAKACNLNLASHASSWERFRIFPQGTATNSGNQIFVIEAIDMSIDSYIAYVYDEDDSLFVSENNANGGTACYGITRLEFEFVPERDPNGSGFTYWYIRATNSNNDNVYLSIDPNDEDDVKRLDAPSTVGLNQWILFDNKHYAIRNDSRGNTIYIKAQGDNNEDVDTQTYVGSDERWYVVPHGYSSDHGHYLIVSFESVDKNKYMKASCGGGSGSQDVVMSEDDTDASQFEMIPVPLEENTFYLRNRSCREQYLTKNGGNNVKTHWKNHPYDAGFTSSKPGDPEKWTFEKH